MKSPLLNRLLLFAATFSMMFLLVTALYAQNPVGINDSFTGIIVDGPVTVYLEKADAASITVKGKNSDKPIESLYSFSLKNNTLKIESKSDNELELIVKYIQLDNIRASNIASVKTSTSLTGNSITVAGEGASDLDLEINAETVYADISGASTAKLRGSATQFTAKASGAADIKAFDLITTNANIETSGAADVKVDVTGKLDVISSGASDVKVKTKPAEVNADVSGVATLKYGDEEDFNIEEFNADIEFPAKKKFDGHWGGIELGLNTFVDNTFNASFPAPYGFLDLQQNKSLTVQLNLIEQNIPLSSNNFGMVTGLGLWVNNYRFSNNIQLGHDGAAIYGFADTTLNYTKSKLTVSYLVLPLLFEYQVLNHKGKEIFHFAAGGYGAVKLGSKTKTVHLENNTKVKTKFHDAYHLNPFKYGVMARIGWRKVNFFANYNLSAIFKNNEGPEMYPFEVGITLLGW